jgi:hypothetical protein
MFALFQQEFVQKRHSRTNEIEYHKNTPLSSLFCMFFFSAFAYCLPYVIQYLNK